MELKTINGKDLIPSEWNPRSEFNEEKLNLLKESIKGIGLVEPLVVRPAKENGKYLITAGERRWRSNQDNDFICIVRNENELNAKVSCLVENYVRENIADEDHEKFIFNIYKEGIKSKKWDSQNKMSKITGMPRSVISSNIEACEDRQSLSLSAATLTTTDILDSKSLKEKPKVRKKLLERRAKDDIKGSHAVRNWAVELNKLPEQIALEVVETANELQDVKVAVEVHTGVREPGLFRENGLDRLSRMDVIELRCDRIIDITPSMIDMIDNIKERDKAIKLLKKTYEHLHMLLVELKEIEVVEIDKKEPVER